MTCPGMTQVEPWIANPNHVDERPHRLRVVSELIRFHRIDTVMSHVWWSDRFALGLRRLTAFRWYIKMCGCYEFLMQNPDVDSEFYENTAAIMRLVDGVTYGAAKNLAVFGGSRITPPRAVRRILQRIFTIVTPRRRYRAAPTQ